MKNKLLPTLRDGVKRLSLRIYRYFRTSPHNYLYAAFLLPAFFTLLFYTFCGVYPIGKLSVLVLDLNAQYVYFYNALRDAVFGEGSLLYSFARGLGGEFMGIYTYYLASPLSYLVCLFPRENVTEALYLIFILKSGLCGLTFSYFLRTTAGTPRIQTIVLSTLYAFSGYAICLQSNTMWIDAVYLFPLIALGIYRLIREKKTVLYILALSATLLFNYYIGYMSCILVLFYFFTVFFSMEPDVRNPEAKRGAFVSALLRIGIASVIGILIAAVSILPAYYSLTFGKDTFTSPEFTFTANFSVLDLFGKLLYFSYDTIRPEGLPFLYSGILTLFLVPLFFSSSKIPRREKLAFALTILVFFTISFLRASDLVMHGFQAPNWMNCRYAFIFPFLFLFCAGRYLAAEKDSPPKKVVLPTAIVLLTFSVAFLIFGSDESKIPRVFPVVLSAILIVYYAVFLISLSEKPNLKHTMHAVTAGVLAVEIVASGCLSVYALDRDVSFSWRYSFTNYGERFTDVVKAVNDEDSTLFYRSERTVSRKMNDAFQIGIKGLSGSTSTLNRSQIDFLSYLGLVGRSNYTQYDYPNPVSDMLLGVKYIYTVPGKEPNEDFYTLRYIKYGDDIFRASDGYSVDTRTETVQNKDGSETEKTVYYLIGMAEEMPMKPDKDVLVYEYTGALPLGYCVSADAAGITFTQPEIDESGEYILPPNVVYYTPLSGDGRSAFYLQSEILSRLCGEKMSLYTPVKHTVTTSGVTATTTYRTYEKFSPDGATSKLERFYSTYYRVKQNDEGTSEKGTVTFTFTGIEGKHIYMYIPAATYDAGNIYTVNGGEPHDYFGIFDYGIVDLGVFPAGSENKVVFTVGEKEGMHVAKNIDYFFTMNEEALATAHNTLASSDFTLTSFRDDAFTATVRASEEHPLLCVTLPYDEGWIVTVDGEPVNTVRVLDTLLGVELTPGEHIVSFRYFPTIYKVALLLSSCGVVAFIGYAVLPPVFRKRKQKKLAEKQP